MERTVGDRVDAARHVWFLARARGDDRLAKIALLDLLHARRAERAANRPVKTVINEREVSKLLDEYRPDWA